MAETFDQFNFGVAKDPKELAKMLGEMQKKIDGMKRIVKTRIGKAMVQAGELVEARAKEILTEKGHIDTGTLRRSLNTQVKVERASIIVEVGSPLIYAEPVEALPDGGYLGPAAEQTFDLVTRHVVSRGVNPALKSWAKKNVKGGGP